MILLPEVIIKPTRQHKNRGTYVPLFIALLLLTALPASAYVGPGAGFGIVTSFLVFLNAIMASLLSLLLWPINLLRRYMLRSRRQYKPLAQRVIVLGLDGFSPKIAKVLMDEDELPNLKSLQSTGTFGELTTTCPGISPVAWSSFQTGVNPGKHGIFDFLAPDRMRYLPVLSSVKSGSVEKNIGIGPFKFESEKPFVRLLRKSKPFWIDLKKYGIRSTILRVPITYPPEPLDGHLLSGMCVPDLRGTQGSYTVFSQSKQSMTGGIWSELHKAGKGCWKATLTGPETRTGELSFTELKLIQNRKGYSLAVGDKTKSIIPNKLTPWIELTFKDGRTKVKAIARFCLTFDNNEPLIYATALHVNPFSPAVPISHPVHYSRYLAGLHGPFATLGLAEDTWALSNDITSASIFLEQAWSIFDEREKMFFDALKLNKKGLVVCVFDTSDRIQHMFWKEGIGIDAPVRTMYKKMDELIGKTLKKLRKKDHLLVISDHGFTSFHTCIDFNKWLQQEGYLVLEQGVETVDTSFKGVDWTQTRAWAMGLAGIMLNIKGREGHGIVDAGEEASELIEEICIKLSKLTDSKGNKVIHGVYPATDVYSGPYCDSAPDIIIGTAEGYRASWGCVTGGIGANVLYPNERHWNGDHCHDSTLIPGSIASNITLNKKDATIIDIAPTILRALGIAKPEYMEGKSLLCEESIE